MEKRDSAAFAVLNASGCRVREQVCGQLEGRGWTSESCVQVQFPLQSYTLCQTRNSWVAPALCPLFFLPLSCSLSLLLRKQGAGKPSIWGCLVFHPLVWWAVHVSSLILMAYCLISRFPVRQDLVICRWAHSRLCGDFYVWINLSATLGSVIVYCASWQFVARNSWHVRARQFVLRFMNIKFILKHGFAVFWFTWCIRFKTAKMIIGLPFVTWNFCFYCKHELACSI